MMIPRKFEVLEELDLGFINALLPGDVFMVKADNRDSEDIVRFDSFTDAYILFILEGRRLGVFFQEIREHKIKVFPKS